MDKTNQNTFIVENAINDIQVPGMALRSNAGIPTPSEDKKEAIFFIDANNWYHNVKKYYNPSMIDITKLISFLAEVKNYATRTNPHKL